MLDNNPTVAPQDRRLWPVQPGDAIVFHGRVIHGAGGHLAPTPRCRAVSLRWRGDDAAYDDRPGTHTFDKAQQPGSRLGGASYPRAWPREVAESTA